MEPIGVLLARGPFLAGLAPTVGPAVGSLAARTVAIGAARRTLSTTRAAAKSNRSPAPATVYPAVLSKRTLHSISRSGGATRRLQPSVSLLSPSSLGATMPPKRAAMAALRAFSSDVEDLKHEDVNESDNSASSTGVIDVKEQEEVILYFDHVYQLSLSKLSLRHYFKWLNSLQFYHDDETIKARIMKLSSTEESPLSHEANIKEFIPVKRDGGAFVKFTVPPDTTPKALIQQICDNIRANEANEPLYLRAFNKLFNLYPKSFQVKGTPWIEDLRRFPSPRLKVMFEGDQLTEEELYFLFRRYGAIVDIIPSSPTLAYVLFANVRSAISAKNCITGIKLNKNKTSLHIQYDPLKKMNYITDFVVNHQRVAVPAILALLATLAVLIFDPIREKFIEHKITHKYSLETYKDNWIVKIVYGPYKMLTRSLSSGYDYFDDMFNESCEMTTDFIKRNAANRLVNSDSYSSEFDEDGDDDNDASHPNIIWLERFEKVKQLKMWIYENINTYIIVKGPKGSGKQEFVLDHALLQDEHLKKKILYIDCDTLVKTRSDNSMLQATAHQLGYFPLFTWTNSISQFIDLGVQGITGQKSGLSESKETQLKNMFSLTTSALRNVALEDYSSYKRIMLKRQRKKEREQQRHGNQPKKPAADDEAGREDGASAAAIANANLEEESSLLVDDELLKEDQYLQQHPECKPIIVINKYLRKADSNQDFIYKMIADWTSQVVQANLAHVIYITHDVGSIQNLTDSLPNQVFKTISLSDATSKSSKQYVLNQLAGTDYRKSGSVDHCLEPIGGRMLDLQAFIRRVRSGESPSEALDEMVNQAAEQITTFFLNKSAAAAAAEDLDHNWSSAQVWTIMKLLSSNDKVKYTELTKNPLFKSSADTLSTLSTLEKHDLISLDREKGILNSIATGRPLYKEAFKNLVHDSNIFKIYETEYYNDLITIESTKIAKLEEEIAKISRLNDLKMLKTRLDYVQSKIIASTEKIISYEEDIKYVGSEKKNGSVLAKIGLA